VSAVVCDYCGQPARFHSTSSHIYGRDYGPVWDCRPCDAFVGCHPNRSPKGTLAKKPRREARKAVHALFDHLWQDWLLAYPGALRQSSTMKQVMRVRAYEWLAHHLGIPVEQTHIAMFDELMCTRAIAVLRELKPTAASVREWAKQKRRVA
jgi:hypothetical protein